MQSIDTNKRPFWVGSIVSLAGSLLIAPSAGAHQGDGQRLSMREARLANPGMSRQDIRQIVRSARMDARELGTSRLSRLSLPQIQNLSIPTNEYRSLPTIGAVGTDIANQTRFITDKGKNRAIQNGLELDLNSEKRTIIGPDQGGAGAGVKIVSNSTTVFRIGAGTTVNGVNGVISANAGLPGTGIGGNAADGGSVRAMNLETGGVTLSQLTDISVSLEPWLRGGNWAHGIQFIVAYR